MRGSRSELRAKVEVGNSTVGIVGVVPTLRGLTSTPELLTGQPPDTRAGGAGPGPRWLTSTPELTDNSLKLTLCKSKRHNLLGVSSVWRRRLFPLLCSTGEDFVEKLLPVSSEVSVRARADLYPSLIACSASAAVVAETSNSNSEEFESPVDEIDLELCFVASIAAFNETNSEESEGMLSSLSPSMLSMLEIELFSRCLAMLFTSFGVEVSVFLLFLGVVYP